MPNNNKKKNKRGGGSKKVKKTPGGKTRRDGAIKISSEMSKSIENMMKVMNQHNLVNRGLFFDDALVLTEGKAYLTDVTELLKKASIGKSGNDKINIIDNMRSALRGAAQPMKIIFDHVKDGISREDYSAWNEQKILQFLQEHKLRPYPVPSKTIVLELANEMKIFALACLRKIETDIPEDDDDDDTAVAIGRQAMGIATPQDTAIVNKMNAPVKRKFMIAEAQISSNFRLNNLQKWDAKRHHQLQYYFNGLVREWCAKQNVRANDKANLRLEVAKSLMGVACVYDSMIGTPGKDIVCCMNVLKDTPSWMVLQIRPLYVWIMKRHGSGNIPVPIIAVEWHRAKQVEGVKRAQ